MNRNTESHFKELPRANVPRSMMDLSSELLTSFNAGELIPLDVREILPGDTVQMTTSKVIRAQTLLSPIFSNMYFDTYYFFVPNRLVWEHWSEFMGENKTGPWIPETEYALPRISSPEGGWSTGTIADYFGLPANTPMRSGTHTPIALPFRGYALICNEFFRDENISSPLNIPLGDANQTGSNGDDYINDVANGGKPFKVSKYHDYFTSCLPSPQKGNPVNLPFTAYFPATEAPVRSRGIMIDKSLYPATGGSLNTLSAWRYDIGDGKISSDNLYIQRKDDDGTLRMSTSRLDDSESNADLDRLFPSNLWAHIPEVDVGQSSIDINQLRLAFATQHYLEAEARGGSRLRESILAHFGVSSPDARLDVPEYLGGNRIRLNVREVENQSSSDDEFLGDLGGVSSTSDVHYEFTKSFTEHGFLFCLGCVRYDHTYAQGIDRFWMHSDRLSFYSPEFANLGEMPVYTDELYYDESNSDDVFGYQEAWASYRYGRNHTTGEMSVTANNPLNTWHLGDYYESAPTLSSGWLFEDINNVDRVLTVSHTQANQFFGNFYFKAIFTRPMPMFSIPGLNKM